MGLRWVLVLTAALVSVPVTGQSNAPNLSGELSARYADLKSAFASKNEPAIRAVFAPDFVEIDVDGKSDNVGDMIKEVLSLPAADLSRQSHTTILSVSRTGDTANVEQRYEMSEHKKGADGTDKSVVLTTLSKDIWINDKGVWRIARTVTEQLDFSVDGVTVLHKVNPKPAQTTPDDERWEQLKSRIELAPQDVAAFIERRTGCNHFDGEVGSGYPEREQIVQNKRKELRCDQIDADERALRTEHRNKPDVLQLMEETKHLLPW